MDPASIAALAGTAGQKRDQLLGVGTSMFNFFTGQRQNNQNRAWQEHMFRMQRDEERINWNNQNEYNSPSAQLARWKAAGLNPHTFGGGQYTTGNAAQMPAVSQPGLPQQYQLQMDTSSMQNSMMNIAQLRKTWLEGDSQSIENQFKPLEKTIGITQTQALTAQTNEATANLKETNAILQEQKISYKIQNYVSSIQALWEKTKQELIRSGMEKDQANTEAQTKLYTEQLGQVNATIAQLKSIVTVNQSNVKVMEKQVEKLMSEKGLIDAQTQTENETREYKKGALERQNFGIGAPVIGAGQIIRDNAKKIGKACFATTTAHRNWRAVFV